MRVLTLPGVVISSMALFSSLSFAQESACRTISGSWKTPSNLQVMLNNDSCRVTGRFDSSKYRHDVEVTYLTSQGAFIGTIVRTQLSNSCRGVLETRIEIQDANSLRVNSKFSSGETCEGVGPGFSPPAEIWIRN